MNNLTDNMTLVQHAEMSAHFREAVRHLNAIIPFMTHSEEGTRNLQQATYDVLNEWSLYAGSYDLFHAGEESPYPKFCASCEVEPFTTDVEERYFLCPHCASKRLEM
jgi:hypothetical protein